MKYSTWELDEEENQAEHLTEIEARQAEIDAILKPLYTKEAVNALTYIKDRLIEAGIAHANDTQVAIGIRQGELNTVLNLLNSAERVNNGR